MNMDTVKINGVDHYIDDRNNKWSGKKYTKESAKYFSTTLIGESHDNTNCENLADSAYNTKCTNCTSTHYSVNCHHGANFKTNKNKGTVLSRLTAGAEDSGAAQERVFCSFVALAPFVVIGIIALALIWFSGFRQ